MSSLSAVGPSLGDAMLVASELVTNAVRHSGCQEHESLDVAVHRYDHHLTISVHDPGASGREPQIPPLTERAAESLGLRIVEELTSRWGSERRDGYVVWAELPISVYANTL
jgi:serine/threonine-protein kinase RsbW